MMTTDRSRAEQRLMNKAVHYLGRYSASRQRLREVLQRFAMRKLEAHEEAEVARAIDAVLDDCIRLGYVDDAALPCPVPAANGAAADPRLPSAAALPNTPSAGISPTRRWPQPMSRRATASWQRLCGWRHGAGSDPISRGKAITTPIASSLLRLRGPGFPSPRQRPSWRSAARTRPKNSPNRCGKCDGPHLATGRRFGLDCRRFQQPENRDDCGAPAFRVGG